MKKVFEYYACLNLECHEENSNHINEVKAFINILHRQFDKTKN